MTQHSRQSNAIPVRRVYNLCAAICMHCVDIQTVLEN